MRLRRSSSQTTGAKASSDQDISPRVRKDPPFNGSLAKASRRTRRSVTSTDKSNSSPKISRLQAPTQEPGPYFRRRGARKSRQNVQINREITTHVAVLKDSSVTANSSRDNVEPHLTSGDRISSGQNDCKSELTVRGKKKQIAKDHADETQLFEVEDILDVKLKNGRYYYFVKWKGYSAHDNTWEPEEHLPSDLLEHYFKNSCPKTQDEANVSICESDNFHLDAVNRENTNNSSHSLVGIGQMSNCFGNTTVTVNGPPVISPPSTSSYESHLHNDRLSCSSFQANSQVESNGGSDLPHSGPINDFKPESSSDVHFNYDPLSLSNLKPVIVDKASVSPHEFSSFQLNDSLVPGKIVCIDKSPFGTGKMALIKWVDHEPTTWLDYDFVKFKYPELLVKLYEDLIVIDSTVPN